MLHSKTICSGANSRQNAAIPAPPCQMSSVEHGDDKNGGYVIDNCQSRQEYLEAKRYTITEERHHADGECNIGRHWYAPATSARPV